MIEHRYQQGSEAWFRARAGRPTASEFSRILTPTGKDSSQWLAYVWDLCAECLRPDEIEFAGNRHTDRGNELEPEAREIFAAAHPTLQVEETGFVTRDDQIVGCSPDSLLRDATTLELVAGLEIKCPTARHHCEALRTQQMPSKHMPQVHGSMAVTGLDHWYFMSYARGLKPFVTRIDRDDYTDKLSNALDRFVIYYQSHRPSVIKTIKI